MINQNENIDYAHELFAKGLDLHSRKEFYQAIDVYTASIKVFPTPEAYTYRGWSYSMIGDFDKAIVDCESAIELDPDYGNPYNDIGSYLLAQGRYEESRLWLEKALTIERYELKHYPYFNLGRLYEIKREWFIAIDYYRMALELNPHFTEAHNALLKVIALTN